MDFDEILGGVNTALGAAQQFFNTVLGTGGGAAAGTGAATAAGTGTMPAPAPAPAAGTTSGKIDIKTVLLFGAAAYLLSRRG
jgi:hypothetical protein